MRPHFRLLYNAIAWASPAFLAAVVWAESATRAPHVPGTNGSSKRVLAAPARREANPFQPAREEGAKLPVAVDGYCVASLRDSRQWIHGLPQHQLVFDGQIYWFASERQRAVFAAAPGRYVPALAGHCVTTYFETGRRIPGKAEFGLVHGQRLYFFASRAAQNQFRKDPRPYATVDVANGGDCVVSKIDDGRKIAGMPETLVIVAGMRYLFAGQSQQAQFLATMDRYGATLPVLPSPEASQRLPRVARPAGRPAGEPKPQQAAKGPNSLRQAMQGYCAVSIRSGGLWQSGNPAYQTQFDGRQYLFAGPDELELFSRNPNAYVPALGGDCPVSKVDFDRRVPGSVFHPVTYLNRLYLLAGASEILAFRANPAAYANADLAADGNCVVTLAETSQTAAGRPEFVTWHGGLRYYFVSEVEQEKFRVDPGLYQLPLGRPSESIPSRN